MKPLKKASGIRRNFPVAFVGVLLISGGLLVVRGEWQKRTESQAFGAAQVAMRQAIGVFPESDDASQSVAVSSVDTSRVTGLLEAPTIDLSVAIVDYIEYKDLETAVSRMTTSANLGQPGTTVIVGHRTGFGQPFLDLDQLKIDDQITITLRDGTKYRYAVAVQKIVSPTTDLSEFDQVAGNSKLILVTCNPKFTTDERLIIVAKFLYGGSQ